MKKVTIFQIVSAILTLACFAICVYCIFTGQQEYAVVAGIITFFLITTLDD